LTITVPETTTINTTNTTIYTAIVTARNFHNYEITITFTENSPMTTVIQPQISRCYARYSFYESDLNVKVLSSAVDGFLLIPLTLPDYYINTNNTLSRQLLAVYDRAPNTTAYTGDYEYRNLLSAQPFNSTNTDYAYTPVRFVNATSVSGVKGANDATVANETTYRVLLQNPDSNSFDLMYLSRNISFVFENASFSSESLTLYASNGFQSVQTKFTITNNTGGSDDSSNLWIYFLVLGLILVAILVVVAVKFFGKRKTEERSERQALLEHN